MTLTNFETDPLLDLPAWVGQRQATFRFALSDAVTHEELGEIHPTRTAVLTHDTTRTIKRQLNLSLGAADTAATNGLTQRINVYMTFPNGTEYPLGRYMFTDTSRAVYTAGKLGSFVLNDEMFLVDQKITTGINGVGSSVTSVVETAVAGLGVSLLMEGTPFTSMESWSIGTGRGQVLESLSVSGDFFSPWFDNNGKLNFIRTFDPALKIPDFDFDSNNKVLREPIIETDDLLTAPNIFIVVSNSSETLGSAAVVGRYDVPPSAPHSVANRGFTIAQVENLQLSDSTQAAAVATGLGIRQTIFQRVTLTTPPDPRHDSYNVIRWQGANWLELGWSMALTEGAPMNHVLRKSYSA
jgi:hypothetical protein